jgi:dihydrofolate synthase/folylpolyglutamate synthase
VLIAAVLADKNWRAMLPPLFKMVDHAVLTQAPSAPLDRRWDPGEAVTERGAGIAEIRADLDDALDRARDLAGDAGTIVVTGSAHTVGDALRRLGLADCGDPSASTVLSPPSV